MNTGVAVVIPAFNHAAYLAAAIDSVLAQDYADIDLLVIDDGSTDDTPRVLERYGSKLRWYSRANRGQSSTLNEGWTKTRGDLLLYLGDDDVLLPGAVAAAVATMEADASLVGVYGDYLIIDDQSRTLRRVRMPDVDLPHMLRDFMTPPAAGAVVRRSVWQAVGGWDESLRQVPDRDFYQRAMLLGRMARLDALLAVPCARGIVAFAARLELRGRMILVVDCFSGPDLPQQSCVCCGRAQGLARVVRHGPAPRDWPAALRHWRTRCRCTAHRGLADRLAIHRPAWRVPHGESQLQSRATR